MLKLLLLCTALNYTPVHDKVAFACITSYGSCYSPVQGPCQCCNRNGCWQGYAG